MIVWTMQSYTHTEESNMQSHERRLLEQLIKLRDDPQFKEKHDTLVEDFRLHRESVYKQAIRCLLERPRHMPIEDYIYDRITSTLMMWYQYPDRSTSFALNAWRVIFQLHTGLKLAEFLEKHETVK